MCIPGMHTHPGTRHPGFNRRDDLADACSGQSVSILLGFLTTSHQTLGVVLTPLLCLGLYLPNVGKGVLELLQSWLKDGSRRYIVQPRYVLTLSGQHGSHPLQGHALKVSTPWFAHTRNLAAGEHPHLHHPGRLHRLDMSPRAMHCLLRLPLRLERERSALHVPLMCARIPHAPGHVSQHCQ